VAGKVIIIFPMMVEMRGKMVPGLRVRIPPPKHGGQVAAVKAKPSGNGQTAVTAKPKPPVDEELDDVDAPPAQSKTTDADEFDDEILGYFGAGTSRHHSGSHFFKGNRYVLSDYDDGLLHLSARAVEILSSPYRHKSDVTPQKISE
jgi:hypothetical protein